eukprot:c26975_g1_i1 orf=569-2698(-)
MMEEVCHLHFASGSSSSSFCFPFPSPALRNPLAFSQPFSRHSLRICTGNTSECRTDTRCPRYGCPSQWRFRHSICVLGSCCNWRFPAVARTTPFVNRCVGAQSAEATPVVDSDEEIYLDTDEVSEEEARRRNWIERGWAPWEEILSPEAQFAVDSLREGEESIMPKDAFRKLAGQVDGGGSTIEGEDIEAIGQDSDANGTDTHLQQTDLVGTPSRKEPCVFMLVPPKDWPPPGWEVDETELAFIKEAHSLEDVRITGEDLENASTEVDALALDRWKMFLQQYEEWVAANKDILEQEVLESEEEYYPGRRRTGDNYEEGMYELPFVHPGQHYWGVVTYANLYEGAFVYYGGVHDGWIPIRDNDWYYIRHRIKVGMRVQVEVLAKRDPYRFRFPVEMRFVDPNIDELIFRRFEHPPIFFKEADINLDELARETGRPYVPRRRPEIEDEEEPEIVCHPYIPKVWQIHMAEQTVLDHEDGFDDMYDSDGNSLENLNEGEIEQYGSKENAFWIEDYKIGDSVIPKLVLNQDEEELDLEVARAERKAIYQMWEEAQERDEEFRMPKLKRELYMDELNEMHKQRFLEEREALQRDQSCRMEFGLPLEEPGKFVDASFFGKNLYNPREKRWRHDYFEEPAKPTDIEGEGKNDPLSSDKDVVEDDQGHPNGVTSIDENEQRTKSDALPCSQTMINMDDTNLVNGKKVDIKGTLDTMDD